MNTCWPGGQEWEALLLKTGATEGDRHSHTTFTTQWVHMSASCNALACQLLLPLLAGMAKLRPCLCHTSLPETTVHLKCRMCLQCNHVWQWCCIHCYCHKVRCNRQGLVTASCCVSAPTTLKHDALANLSNLQNNSKYKHPNHKWQPWHAETCANNFARYNPLCCVSPSPKYEDDGI